MGEIEEKYELEVTLCAKCELKHSNYTFPSRIC